MFDFFMCSLGMALFNYSHVSAVSNCLYIIYIYICIYGADLGMAVLTVYAAYSCIIIALLYMYG